MLIFFKMKAPRILFFLVDHNINKTNIIRHYLLPNSTTLKLSQLVEAIEYADCISTEE